MAVNTDPIFVKAPIVGIATLTTPTAVTSRANITGTTNLTQLTATSTDGTRVDRILVQAKGNTAAAQFFIWVYNATTSFLMDEFTVAAVTASNTAPGFTIYKDYDFLVLPPTYQLFVSTTIQQDYNAFAFGGTYS